MLCISEKGILENGTFQGYNRDENTLGEIIAFLEFFDFIAFEKFLSESSLAKRQYVIK